MRKSNKMTRKNLVAMSLVANMSLLRSMSLLRRFLSSMPDGRHLYREVHTIEEKQRIRYTLKKIGGRAS